MQVVRGYSNPFLETDLVYRPSSARVSNMFEGLPPRSGYRLRKWYGIPNNQKLIAWGCANRWLCRWLMGNGQPSSWSLAGTGICSATSKLGEGSSLHGGQQWGILGNERQLDPLTIQEWVKDSSIAVNLFWQRR